MGIVISHLSDSTVCMVNTCENVVYLSIDVKAVEILETDDTVRGSNTVNAYHNKFIEGCVEVDNESHGR